MISKIIVKNYKSFDSQDIELKALNLFTGANSAGKTSAIHAILSAADNLEAQERVHLSVSRHLFPMTFNELRNYLKNAKSYEFSLFSTEGTVSLLYEPADDAMVKTRVRQSGVPATQMFEQLKSNLFYLPAMRLAKLDDTSINTNPEMNELGLYGEYVADYFQNHRNDIINDELLQQDTTHTLEAQVNFWLRKMTGYTMSVNFDGSKYSVRFIGRDAKELLPFHVGTGVSYIAQVLTVCLAAKRNSLLIVENPEIHLHPSAQAAMVNFFAIVANSGRQIIVESHSDHIFNGVRRLLHHNEITLQNVAVLNFVQDDQGFTRVTNVELSQNGGILKYVPGLFDQVDEDLDSILE